MNKKFGILATLWLVQFVNYLDRVNIAIAGPSIMKSLSLDLHSFGFALAAFTFGYCIMQIPGGLLADRYGARRILIAAPLLWSIFTGLTSLVDSLTLLIVVRVCFGMAEGSGNAAWIKVLADNFSSKDRAKATSFVVTALAIGPAAAAPIVAMLLLKFGWQGMFLTLAIPGALVSILIYFMVTNQRDHQVITDSYDHGDKVHWKELLKRPTTLVFSLAYFSYNIAYWGYIGWMPSYLSMERHIDIKGLGTLAGIPYVFGFLGILLSGWLGSGVLFRYRPSALVGCNLGAAVGLYVAYSSTDIALCMTGLSATAFFCFGNLVLYGSLLQDLAPVKGRASFAGLISTFGQLGGLVAPVLIGYLVRTTGSFTSGFLFMICALCVSAVAYATLGKFLAKTRRLTVASTQTA